MLIQVKRKILRPFRNFLRYAEYSIRFWPRGINIEASSWVSLQAKIQGCVGAEVRIGGECEIHPYSMIISRGGNITLGDCVSLNPFSIIYGVGNVFIGDGVRIAASVTIIPANHIQGTDEVPLTKSGISHEGISIGDNVWIGTGARILDGVSIGNNAVIGAGSVVTRDVPAGKCYVGVPARPITPKSINGK